MSVETAVDLEGGSNVSVSESTELKEPGFVLSPGRAVETSFLMQDQSSIMVYDTFEPLSNTVVVVHLFTAIHTCSTVYFTPLTHGFIAADTHCQPHRF